MVRNIFIPDKIGSYYVFAQRVVACEITKSQVRMAIVTLKGRERIIEQVIERPLENNSAVSYHDRVVDALTALLVTIGHYDALHVVVPANMVVFKEITLPFVDVDKIKLIVPFEVEPFLPFPLSDVTLDCIITQTQESASTVFVAAIKNEVLAEQMELFKRANADVTKVTVDLFELFALYQALSLDKLHENHVLIYMGLHTTRMEVIIDGQLKAMRFLSQGLIKLAKMLGNDTEHLVKVGIDSDNPETLALAGPFFADVQLTLDATSDKLPPGARWTKILLTGLAADVKNLNLVIEKIVHIPCELFGTHTLLQHGIATFKENHNHSKSSIIAISSALSLPLTQDFNLDKAHAEKQEATLLSWRLVTALMCMALIVGSLIVRQMFTAHRFQGEIDASEKEVIGFLKKEFPALGKRSGMSSLDAVRKAAQSEMSREKIIWFALSPQNRSSFLIYLQEISTRLDPDGLGLVLTRLTLTDETMMIEGSVKDYEALNRLEEDLRQSKLFSNVPRLEELKFSAKITLNKTFGDHS